MRVNFRYTFFALILISELDGPKKNDVVVTRQNPATFKLKKTGEVMIFFKYLKGCHTKEG